MTVTRDIRAVTPVTKGAKEKFVAYGLRGPAELKRRCEEIAAQETRRVGYPVSASAVMRRFISQGCQGMAK